MEQEPSGTEAGRTLTPTRQRRRAYSGQSKGCRVVVSTRNGKVEHRTWETRRWCMSWFMSYLKLRLVCPSLLLTSAFFRFGATGTTPKATQSYCRIHPMQNCNVLKSTTCNRRWRNQTRKTLSHRTRLEARPRNNHRRPTSSTLLKNRCKRRLTTLEKVWSGRATRWESSRLQGSNDTWRSIERCEARSGCGTRITRFI